MTGRSPKRGRPPAKEGFATIQLKRSVFELWRKKKQSSGYGPQSNSNFAEYLLHCGPASANESKLTKRQRLDFGTPGPEPAEAIPGISPVLGQKRRVASTPLSSRRRVENDSCGDTDSEVDITGSSCPSFTFDEMDLSIDTTTKCRTINKSFSSIDGDPFKAGTKSDSASDDSTDSESDVDDPFSRISILLNASDSESECESSDGNSGCSISEDELLESDREDDDELTLTAVEGNFPELADEQGSANLMSTEHQAPPVVNPTATKNQAPPIDPNPGTESGEKRVETQTLAKRLEEAFEGLAGRRNDNFSKMVEKLRVVVTMDRLLELFGGTCDKKGCNRLKKVRQKCEGGVVVISWDCGLGHSGQWESSEVLCEKGRGQKVYVNTVLLAGSVLVSGNNFDKVALLSKCLNLNFPSKSTYQRIQKLYAVPAIRAMWVEMQDVMEKVFQGESMVLAGDGRNDSPGYCAQYCVYSVMDEVTKVIVDVEIKDKRETGGSSTAMEVAAVKVLLERLAEKFKLGEFTTDASSSVMALIKKLKEKHPSLAELFHNLDIWHKACKLTKALSEAAKLKGCDEIAQWIEPIRNHFWHCCEACGGDVNKLKEMWIGVVHHVVGEHEWAESQCSHGPLTSTEQNKTYLPKTSKSAEAIRKIVLEQKWLKSMAYYVNFRHISGLESFNSMLAKYAPKRNSFEFLVYTARILLAVLDHNLHAFRPVATTTTGKPKYSRKYSKRTKKWHAQPEKVQKDYKHWPKLMGNILQRRFEDKESIRRSVQRPVNHPKNLAATIAMKQPTSTSELVQFRNKRYGIAKANTEL